MHRKPIQRNIRGIALVSLVALGLTSCAGDTGTDEVQLRWSWWGSDTRATITQEIIEAFEEEHPHISVEGAFSGSMSDHMDLVTTQVAGGDAPDIIQTEERYFREYVDRGALLELDQVDVSGYDENALAGGAIDEALYGLTTGDNAFVILANTQLFEEAGVDLPDDTSWTWEDYEEIAQEISDSLEGVYGAASPTIMGMVQVWLRQQGAHIATDDGELGFDAEDIEGLFEMDLELMKNGTLQPADLAAETQEADLEQSLIAQGTAAMTGRWSNQIADLSELTGSEIVPLRYPSPTGTVEDNGMVFKASQLMTVSSTTEHPEEAQLFVDFVLNSEEAGLMSLTDRGFPANETVRETILPELGEHDRRSSEFIIDVEPELADPEPIPPAGFGAATDTLLRYYQEVLFERQSPEEAAQNAVDDLEGEIQ